MITSSRAYHECTSRQSVCFFTPSSLHYPLRARLQLVPGEGRRHDLVLAGLADNRPHRAGVRLLCARARVRTISNRECGGGGKDERHFSDGNVAEMKTRETSKTSEQEGRPPPTASHHHSPISPPLNAHHPISQPEDTLLSPPGGLRNPQRQPRRRTGCRTQRGAGGTPPRGGVRAAAAGGGTPRTCTCTRPAGRVGSGCSFSQTMVGASRRQP